MWVSCRSNKIEYKYKIITPDLDFVDFPKPKKDLIPLDKNKEIVRDNETPVEYVLFTFDYFNNLVEFKSEYDVIREQYQLYIKELENLEKALNK